MIPYGVMLSLVSWVKEGGKTLDDGLSLSGKVSQCVARS